MTRYDVRLSAVEIDYLARRTRDDAAYEARRALNASTPERSEQMRAASKALDVLARRLRAALPPAEVV